MSTGRGRDGGDLPAGVRCMLHRPVDLLADPGDARRQARRRPLRATDHRPPLPRCSAGPSGPRCAPRCGRHRRCVATAGTPPSPGSPRWRWRRHREQPGAPDCGPDRGPLAPRVRGGQARERAPGRIRTCDRRIRSRDGAVRLVPCSAVTCDFMGLAVRTVPARDVGCRPECWMECWIADGIRRSQATCRMAIGICQPAVNGFAPAATTDSGRLVVKRVRLRAQPTPTRRLLPAS